MTLMDRKRGRGRPVLGPWGLAMLALAAGGVSAPVQAQSGAVLRAESGSAWWLDKLGNECSALRMFGPTGGEVYVTLSRAGRDQPVSIMLSGASVPVVGVGQNVPVRFVPRGDAETLMTGQGSSGSGRNRAIVLNGMSIAFLARAEATQVMQLDLPTGPLSLRLENMGDVTAHLRSCDGGGRSSSSSGGGRDTSRDNPRGRPSGGTTQPARGGQQPAAAAAQEPRPRNEASWVSGDDLQDVNFAGSIVIDLLVNTEGRVATCTVSQASGNASLDSRICRLLQSRARFDPARDASGNPVQAYYRKRIRFAAAR